MDTLIDRKVEGRDLAAQSNWRPVQNRESDLPVLRAATVPPLRLGRVAWYGNALVAFFVIGLGGWAAFAPLRSAAVAPGIVEPETSRKSIQHLEGGIVRRVLVRDGDVVVPGQPLVDLDDTRVKAERDGLWGQYWDARIREARLLAEQSRGDAMVLSRETAAVAGSDAVVSQIVTGQQKILETRQAVRRSQEMIYRQRAKEIQEQVTGLAARRTALRAEGDLVAEEMSSVAPLVAKKLERQSRLLELKREVADLSGQIGETEAQIAQAGQNLAESEAQFLKTESDREDTIAEQLRDAGNEVLQVGQRMRAADDQLARTVVRAPVAGVVANLQLHTPGGVISPGEPLMDLVPHNDRLVVRVRVRPEDINLVHVGLPARVHLIPYDQRRVPMLMGRVTYVSADLVSDGRGEASHYAATIRVDAGQLASLKDVSLLSGMPVQAMIETGRSTVALYALRPVLDSFGRAFREH